VCGIAGWAGLTPPPASDTLRAMLATMHRRGPDEEGRFVTAEVALGIRRLSIIDVTGGHQPLHSEDGQVVVVGNGEIYNAPELREQLRGRGHRFATGSDIETVVHLYEECGIAALDRLRGMFALAIWDGHTRTLWLARDPFGKKPLLWASTPDGGITFASQLRAFRPLQPALLVDLGAVNHVLTFAYRPVSGSVLQGLHSVPPGSWVRWRDGQVAHDRYWRANLDPGNEKDVRPDDVQAEVRKRITIAVRRRLISERPLGVYLSGGIDSTVIAALAVAESATPVHTYTVGFDDSRFDESGHARAIAAHLGTTHHEHILRPNPVELVEQLADAFDEPFADSSALPTLALNAEAARDGVVVALGGDGGDEVFAGYTRYAATRALQRLDLPLRALAPARPLLTGLARATGNRRAIRLAAELRGSPSLADRYLRMMTYASLAERANLWSDDALLELSLSAPEEAFLTHRGDNRRTDPVAQLQMLDIATYLPGDILVKADLCSMHHSIELRSPLLDRDVVEAAAGLTVRERISGGVGKVFLREFAYDLVPRSIVDRPKMGFGIPRAQWLRGPLAPMTRDLLTDTTAQQRGWFSPPQVEALIAQHMAGHDRDLILWPLLCIEVWARRWLDR